MIFSEFSKFIDRFEPESILIEEQDVPIIESRRKVRSLIGLCLFSSILVGLLFIFRVIIQGKSSEQGLYSILVFSFISGLLPFAIKKTGKYVLISYLFLVVSLFVLPYRIINTGGLLSTGIIWYPIFPIFVTFIHSAKKGFVIFVICCIQLLFIYFAESFGITIGPPDTILSMRLAGVIIAISMYSLIVFLYDKERIRIENVNIETEHNFAKSLKDNSIKQLASGVAHNINNPLAIILGFLHKTKKKIASNDDLSKEDLLHIVNRIEDSAMRITDIVRDIKILSDTSVAKGEEVINLDIVLSELLEGYSKELSTNGISLNYNCEINSPAVFGNFVMLEKVFSSLIDSSISNLIPSKLKNLEVDITSKTINKNENNVIIKFRDTGVEIPEHLKENYLSPFFSTSETGRSSQGLGLAICRAIIERHDGEFYMSDRKDLTEFIVKIPEI